MSVRPGDLVAGGKYRVLHVLAEGGMGVVVAAEHVELGQKVALKICRPEIVEKPDLVARFLAEGRAAAKVQSQHVARVLDVGTLEHGVPYMVLEYLEGSDLADLVDKGPLALADAAQYVLEACEALSEAHALGIVHRDLKPANLFLAKRRVGPPIIKLLDFGISKDESSAPSRRLTSGEAMMGTPHYMSPEQIRASRDVDARADVWALGVVLFELLTGEVPFTGENASAVLAAIAADPPRKLGDIAPDVPYEVQAIIERCLEKDPNKRWPGVAELAEALAPFAPAIASISISRIDIPQSLRPSPAPDTGAPVVAPVLDAGRASRPSDARAPQAAEDAKKEPKKDPQPLTARAAKLRQVGAAAAAAIVAGAIGVLLGIAHPAGASAGQDHAAAAPPAASAPPPDNAAKVLPADLEDAPRAVMVALSSSAPAASASASHSAAPAQNRAPVVNLSDKKPNDVRPAIKSAASSSGAFGGWWGTFNVPQPKTQSASATKPQPSSSSKTPTFPKATHR